MLKRLLLWSGLFLGGAVAGLLIAWLVQSSRTVNTQPGHVVTITLSATIDGSDRFIFTADHVWNDHGKWGAPLNVLFRGQPWEDLSQSPPGWTELAATLDLPRAAVVTRDGRDLVALEPTEEGFDHYIADTPMGAGQYTITISIPRR